MDKTTPDRFVVYGPSHAACFSSSGEEYALTIDENERVFCACRSFQVRQSCRHAAAVTAILASRPFPEFAIDSVCPLECPTCGGPGALVFWHGRIDVASGYLRQRVCFGECRKAQGER